MLGALIHQNVTGSRFDSIFRLTQKRASSLRVYMYQPLGSRICASPEARVTKQSRSYLNAPVRRQYDRSGQGGHACGVMVGKRSERGKRGFLGNPSFSRHCFCVSNLPRCWRVVPADAFISCTGVLPSILLPIPTVPANKRASTSYNSLNCKPHHIIH
ncbi:hypothetical protein LZ31DRAFT_317870 [Colletotrichum somersetense]|nr:hypothetical protein LZ31DRAFT_317870 [Colletotrichum somersetense]